MSANPVIVITGPTGVGKTSLALEVAAQVDGEVLCVDSRQIYRGMDIGTAKPSAVERAAAPHHLLDLADPDAVFSAGRFAAEARRAVAEVRSRGHTVLLVGGSGLYLSALLDGLFAAPPVPEALRGELRRRCREEGLAALWAELGRLDPAAQRALAPLDEVRILRTLELALADRTTRGERWAQQRRAAAVDELPLMFALSRPRDELYRRIDARAGQMLADGWIDEVDRLLGSGFTRHDPGLETMGYADLLRHRLDGVPLDAVLADIRQRTRRYAKRQLTWFGRDRRLRWLPLDRLDEDAAAARIVARWRAVTAARTRAAAGKA